MSAEEQRLADLLKRAVPEPPRELSADEVTMRYVSRPREARSAWGLPALAAAAMLIVGVGVGFAAHQWSSSVPSTPRTQFAPAASQSAGRPAPSRTPQLSPSPSPRCPSPHPTRAGDQGSAVPSAAPFPRAASPTALSPRAASPMAPSASPSPARPMAPTASPSPVRPAPSCAAVSPSASPVAG